MEKRVAFVTGGTGSMGTAICQQLARDGYKVIAGYCHGGNPEKAKGWYRDQHELGYDVEIEYGNVMSWDDCQKAVLNVEEAYGPVSVLVNNAGITRDGSFKKMSREQWDDVIRTDLDGVFNMTRLVINSMSENGFGRVVNISSVNAQKGQFGQVNYAAAKAGMHGLTKALAQEVASKGITVNTVSPGYVESDMIWAVPEKVREQILQTIPVRRFGKPFEIARIVSFLAHEDAGYITGSDISANGGQYMH